MYVFFILVNKDIQKVSEIQLAFSWLCNIPVHRRFVEVLLVDNEQCTVNRHASSVVCRYLSRIYRNITLLNVRG